MDDKLAEVIVRLYEGSLDGLGYCPFDDGYRPKEVGQR